MNKDVKFYRKVYMILIAILLLAIISQISRSQFILNFNQNEKLVKEHERLTSLISDNPNEQLQQDANAPLPYCLVYESDDEQSVQLKDNTEQTLNYMKQSFKGVDISEEDVDPQGCAAVLLTANFESLDVHSSEVEAYVEAGGYVFIMRMTEPDNVFKQLYRKMGIVDFKTISSSTGIHLTSNVLIGQQDLATGQDFLYNNSLYLELDDYSTLLAQSLERIPLMWKREYGEGAFLVYNGDNLYLKSNRGLIAGGVSLMQPDYIYPIFNSKLFYIDDFPAPIRKDDENIYEEYHMDLPTFFREIWWPDMLKTAKKYDVKYTAVAIQTYDDEVEPPFENPEGEDKYTLISFGREVIKSGGELGIHGYNHQSMQLDPVIAKSFGYAAWKSQSDMEASIREMLKYMDSAFPNYHVMSYVPPSNVLGQVGRNALKQAWPELAVIASLYDTDYTDRAYVQEFEVSSDGIIELPRITSGYFDTPYNKWLEANAVTSIGVFSHFLHPDDLLDEERSLNQNWKKLHEDFDDMLARLKDTYPWLRSITSTEAGLDMARVLQTKIQVKHEANGLKVDTTADSFPQHYILRTERKIGVQGNCQVRKIDDNTYLVTANDANFTIGLGR